MSADDVDDSLNLISRVTPGDTINITTREIVRHNSWYTWATRNWYGENKDMLVDWVTGVIQKELTKLKDTRNIVQRKIKSEQLQIATTGIRNLCSTYYGTAVATKLNNLIGTIDKIILAVSQGYSDSIIMGEKPGVIVIDTRFGRSY